MDHEARASFEVRCPVHGTIPFSERERQVINHPLVQRLRCISQLGLASLVFPGATHTRFNHSLGVMHLAGRVFDQIVPTLETGGAGGDNRDYWRTVVRLAGLLHDSGHPPFSHTFEALLPNKGRLPLPRDWYRRLALTERATHEDFSVAAIHALAHESPPLLSLDEARDICALIDDSVVPTERLGGGNGTGGVYPVLKQIISGEIDADRMDYLPRDAHFAGVTYGHFDLERLIRSLASVETPHGRVMALEQSALYTYENFLMARFHMAMQVYFHKTLLAFEYYLTRAVQDGEIDFTIDGSLENLLAAREDLVTALLYRARTARWSQRIVNRQPMRRLLELHDPAYQERRDAILERLREAKIDVVHLREQRRLSTLGLEGVTPIYVQETTLGRTRNRPLHEVSGLLVRYNQVFTIENVYCDQGDYDRAVAALEGVV
jgi:hypothetical protein